MNKGNSCRGIKCRFIGIFAVLALGLLLLSACKSGGSSSSNGTSSTNNGSSNSQTSSTGSNSNANAACDQMTKVVISEHTAAGKEDEYTFTPNHVTIKADEFITFSNQSDEVHVLMATPDAALASSVIDRNEDQPVQFTKAGTYTLESQDAKHRGSMQVTVISAAGKTCGLSAPGTTITFTGKHAQGQSDLYALMPKAVSINAGQSIELLNKTNQALNFSCKPSADITEGNLRVDTDEQQVVQFAKAGQYTCTSTESPAETVSVIVH